MKNEDVKEKIANEVIKDFVWRRRWRLVTWIGISVFSMLAIFKYLTAYGLPIFGNQIAVIGINGEIGQGQIASADKVVPVLRNAFENENVKVVILEINRWWIAIGSRKNYFGNRQAQEKTSKADCCGYWWFRSECGLHDCCAYR